MFAYGQMFPGVHPMASGINAAGERIAGQETPSVESAMLDVGQVAALLRCSTRHVYRLADAGKMPRPFKLGALVRWRRAALLAWLEAGCPPCRGRRTQQ